MIGSSVSICRHFLAEDVSGPIGQIWLGGHDAGEGQPASRCRLRRCLWRIRRMDELENDATHGVSLRRCQLIDEVV